VANPRSQRGVFPPAVGLRDADRRERIFVRTGQPFLDPGLGDCDGFPVEKGGDLEPFREFAREFGARAGLAACVFIELLGDRVK